MSFFLVLELFFGAYWIGTQVVVCLIQKRYESLSFSSLLRDKKDFNKRVKMLNLKNLSAMNTLMKRNGLFPSSFFEDFTRDLLDWSSLSNRGGTVPSVNIVETNDDFKVEMAAPGMKKDDFHVELDNDTLTIHSEVYNEGENKDDERYLRKEFSYQAFQRSFYLPNTVEADKIKAQYKDGLLSLVIPKKAEAKKKPVKTISIS